MLFKPQHFRSPKLLKAAKDQPCVLCSEVGRTIAAHSNMVEHGKGKGIKCPDYFTAWVCQFHHDIIDGRTGIATKEEKRNLWLYAYAKTVEQWFKLGIVVVK